MAGIITQNHESNGLPLYEDANGNQRFLGKLAPDPGKQNKLRRFNAMFPLIPRSQWKPIDRRSTLGTQFITNQRSHGSCVGYSAAQAEMRMRALRGLKFYVLSGAYIYSFINGGRDNGAQITDALDVLVKHGTCLESTVDWNTIYRAQASRGDAEAQRFRMGEGVVVQSFDEAGTALQMGMIPQFALEVGNNFENLDSDGVAGFSPGGGNHSVHADGMKLSSRGAWLLDTPNTWGVGFGQQGRAFTSEKHFSSVQQDAYVHVDQLQDPQDETNPVLPV